MRAANGTFWTVVGLLAGFGLSFGALGLLWIGVAWATQFLMLVPIGLAAFVVCRFGGAAFSVPLGLLPLGSLLVQFRDAAGSHAMPIALVLGWGLAVALGTLLARRAGAPAPRP